MYLDGTIQKGCVHMRSIIKFLFSNNLDYSGAWEEEVSLGNLSESVQGLADKLSAMQPELWKEYQAKLETLHNLERWIEFERGFFMATRLMTEVMEKTLKT